MTDKPENPQAFPLSPGDVSHYEDGMTLRDYFAGQALSKLAHIYGGAAWDAKSMSKASYEYADAMLAERAKNA